MQKNQQSKEKNILGYWIIKKIINIANIYNLIYRTLLNKVAEILPVQLKNIAPDETYNVGKHPESAAITVSSATVTVSITLTSPLMRDATKPASPASGGNLLLLLLLLLFQLSIVAKKRIIFYFSFIYFLLKKI